MREINRRVSPLLRLLGALGWVLPTNYLMLPLGVLLFLVAPPFAIAARRAVCVGLA